MNVRIFTASILIVLGLALLGCQTQPNPVPDASEAVQTPETATSTPVMTDILLPTAPETAIPVPTETASSPSLPAHPVVSGVEIFEFHMVTPARGWAVTRDQNRLLITSDGGEIWLDVTPSGLEALPEGWTSHGIRPFFLDQDTAWFMPNTDEEEGIIFHTQDGGDTWMTMSPPFDNATFEFVDREFGYALVGLGAGAGSHYVAIYRTVDGGQTWEMVFTHEPELIKALPNGGSKNGLTFKDVDHGWIGGAIPMDDYFYLFYTEDGGVTWAQEEEIALPGDYGGSMLEVWQPVFVETGTAFLPVRAYPPEGGIHLLIYRSTDGGENWAFRGAVAEGEAVDFVGPELGWLAAGSALFQTAEGGMTWPTLSAQGIGMGEVFLKVDFVDQLHGWVLTTPDSSTWESLKRYRTENGGENWSLLAP